MVLQLSYRRYALPLRAPLRTAHGMITQREGVLVRLEDAAGRVGFGEAAPLPWFGTETADEDEAAIAGLGAKVEATRLAEAMPARLACGRAALAQARTALDRAGGDAIEPVRHEWLPVAALLPAGRAALAAVDGKLELGFRTFKWKVGVAAPEEELPLLDDLLARLPNGARLRLDANGAWDRRRAERWLERAAERPIEFIEQPIPVEARGAQELLLGLAADFPTPLALDESLGGEGDVERWLGVGWPGVWIVKLALWGEAVATLARLHAAGAGERVVFSSALETAVGARAALLTAARWPHPLRALGFGVYPLFADARCDGPLALAPAWRTSDVAAMDPEAVWTALS